MIEIGPNLKDSPDRRRGGSHLCDSVLGAHQVAEASMSEQDQNLALPFQAGSHSSWTGAREARMRAGSQIARLLALYRLGPLTDHQAAQQLWIPLGSVCGRRSVLLKRLQIQFVDYVPGVGTATQARWEAR